MCSIWLCICICCIAVCSIKQYLSYIGVVITPWIGRQSDIGHHLSINVLLLLIASELTDDSGAEWLSPGVKEYNTPSGASWLYQRLAIMQLTWYNTFCIHTVYADACTADLIVAVKTNGNLRVVSTIWSLVFRTLLLGFPDIFFNLIILKKIIIINNFIYYFSSS